MSLASAASQSNVGAVQSLIDGGENVNEHDADGFTALHRACAIGDVKVILILLKNKANPNLPDSCGDTALHWASFCGHLHAVNVLLKHGANPDVKSSDGKSAIDAAREEGHTGIVRALKHWLDMNISATTAEGADTTGQHVKENPRSPSGKGRGVVLHEAGRIVDGMDMLPTREGALRKKSKNTVLGTTMWRVRYFMLSEQFCGLFVWHDHHKTRIDKSVKFFPYELFYKCGMQNGSKAGSHSEQKACRFDLYLTNGRHFCLEADSGQDAHKWVSSMNKAGGRNMAVLRLQQCWRHYWARQQFEKAVIRSRTERMKGVELVKKIHNGAPSASLITEGPLKKKDYHGKAEMTKMWRNRYFVIDHQGGVIKYYDNKAQKRLNLKCRSIPFQDLISVVKGRGRADKEFTIRVTNG